LLNIIAEEIYINKYQPEIGVARIESKIIDGKDNLITDDHLIAFRISKEEIMINIFTWIKQVIINYFSQTGRMFTNNKLFQYKFEDQLWINLRNFIINLKSLPLWKDRSMASTYFSGKKNYDYWKSVFENGKGTDGADVLLIPLNINTMIRNNNIN